MAGLNVGAQREAAGAHGNEVVAARERKTITAKRRESEPSRTRDGHVQKQNKKTEKKELSRMLSQTRRAKVDGRRWPQHGHKRYPGAKSSICVQTKTMAPDASRQEQEPTLGKRTSADTACKTE